MRKNLTVSVVSVFILLLALELFARYVIKVELLPNADRVQLDTSLGWRWNPGYQATDVYRGQTYRLEINQQGLRNEPVVVPKPAGQRRIIALGDSITAGLGVNLEDTFAKQLQRLAGTGVINAGVDDYGIEQELGWLKKRGLEYEPDLVILGVYLNDSRTVDIPPIMVAGLSNFFLSKSAFYAYYYQLMTHQLAQQAKQSENYRFQFRNTWEEKVWKNDPVALKQVIDEAGQDFGLAWNPSENEKIQHGIKELAELGETHNFEVLVLFFPVSVQVETELEDPWINQPQQWLTEFAKDEGIAYLDLLPVLKEHAEEDIFIDHVHLTPYGHTLVAEKINATLPWQP